MNVVIQAFLGLLGCAAGYIIIGIAAALGKLISGAFLRFQFDEFVFFMVKVYRKGKGVAFCLCEPQPYIGCDLIDTKDSKIRNVIYGAFSMATALFFSETVCIQLFGTKIMPTNSFTIPMCVVMVIYTTVLIILLICRQRLKIGNNPGGIIRGEYERCYAELKEGKEPKELSMKRVEYTGKLTDLPAYKKYLLILYYHFLNLGDYAKVKRVVDEIENYVPDKWSSAELGLLGELVFFYVIISPNEGRAQYYGKQFDEKITGNEDVNIKRIYAYWLFFMKKDKGAALQIAMEALKNVKNYSLPGCRKMEMQFIEALIRKIENS